MCLNKMPGTADNRRHEERTKDTPYKNRKEIAPGERGDEKTLFVHTKKWTKEHFLSLRQRGMVQFVFFSLN